tara:strand:+ start:437 stop:577 length:141 start_codon:yes stop_codon:yes gene_type:complete
MTENLNYFDTIANKQIQKSFFYWISWSNKMNKKYKKIKTKKKKASK